MRRKWSNVAKNPDKGIKDQEMNKLSMWGMINHLPQKGVSRIVTDKILDMDKVTCDRILQSILEEKQMEDIKKQKQQQNRLELRSKLNARHDKLMDLEIRSGVRLGMNTRQPSRNSNPI